MPREILTITEPLAPSAALDAAARTTSAAASNAADAATADATADTTTYDADHNNKSIQGQ